MARPLPDTTHRVAVIDASYASRERLRAMLVNDTRLCVAVSSATDILAMSARARRFTWAYVACGKDVDAAVRLIADVRRAVAVDLPLLIGAPASELHTLTTLLTTRDGIVSLPCASLQLAARLADFARLHQPRPRPSAQPPFAPSAAINLRAGAWWR